MTCYNIRATPKLGRFIGLSSRLCFDFMVRGQGPSSISNHCRTLLLQGSNAPLTSQQCVRSDGVWQHSRIRLPSLHPISALMYKNLGAKRVSVMGRALAAVLVGMRKISTIGRVMYSVSCIGQRLTPLCWSDPNVDVCNAFGVNRPSRCGAGQYNVCTVI